MVGVPRVRKIFWIWRREHHVSEIAEERQLLELAAEATNLVLIRGARKQGSSSAHLRENAADAPHVH